MALIIYSPHNEFLLNGNDYILTTELIFLLLMFSTNS